MSYRFKATLCGILAAFSSGYSHAALDDVARAVSGGDFQTALMELNASPESQRDSIEGQLLHAAALAGSGDLAAAEKQYRSLIDEAPSLPEAYNNLAVLYARQGKLDEARKLLEQAMRTNPSYATVYDNLSNIYLEMSRSAYAKALQIGERQGGAKLQPIYALNAATPVVVAGTAPMMTDHVAMMSSEPASEPADTAALAMAAPEQTTVDEAAVQEPVVAAEAEPLAPAAGDGEMVAAAEETMAMAESEEAVAQTEAAETVVAQVQEPPAAKPDAEEIAGTAAMQEEEGPATVAQQTASASTVAEPMAPASSLQPESAAADSKAKPESADSAPPPQQAIIGVLTRWAADWAGQNVEGYLGAYDESFRPGRGLSYPQWQAQRRKRLSRPGYIEVELGEFKVTLQGDSRATVFVVQRYRSDRYSDKTRKRFQLVRQPAGWKIVSEKTVEVL